MCLSLAIAAGLAGAGAYETKEAQRRKVRAANREAAAETERQLQMDTELRSAFQEMMGEKRRGVQESDIQTRTGEVADALRVDPRRKTEGAAPGVSGKPSGQRIVGFSDRDSADDYVAALSDAASRLLGYDTASINRMPTAVERNWYIDDTKRRQERSGQIGVMEAQAAFNNTAQGQMMRGQLMSSLAPMFASYGAYNAGAANPTVTAGTPGTTFRGTYQPITPDAGMMMYS